VNGSSGRVILPCWAGYTIGAAWVRDFLAADEAVDVVAATLLPAEEFIPGSLDVRRRATHAERPIQTSPDCAERAQSADARVSLTAG
jgi:hypothetical protein